MNWGHLNPYEYHPEKGLYYHEVAPDLLCGSQPQSPADIEHLHAGPASLLPLNLLTMCSCLLQKQMMPVQTVEL